MMQRRYGRSSVISTVLVSAAGAFFFACGDSTPHPPPASDPGGNDAGPLLVTPDGGVAPDGEAADAAVADTSPNPVDATTDSAQVDSQPPPPPLCNAVGVTGIPVSDTVVAGPIPAPAGGTIAIGHYLLTERDFYPDAGETTTDPSAGVVFRAQYVFGSSLLDTATSFGPDDGGPTTDATMRANYTAIGTTLSVSETCPGHVVNNMSFTVNGNELWLFPTGQVREVYTLQ